MKRTKATKLKDIKRKRHVLNAEGQILGRFAVKVAKLLIGKDKPYFSPAMDCGDFVTIINAKDIEVTGEKAKKKIYTRYSGYPGGLKKESFEHLLKRRPEEVLRKAIWGMLPKNKLRKLRLARLKIYPGAVGS